VVHTVYACCHFLLPAAAFRPGIPDRRKRDVSLSGSFDTIGTLSIEPREAQEAATANRRCAAANPAAWRRTQDWPFETASMQQQYAFVYNNLTQTIGRRRFPIRLPDGNGLARAESVEVNAWCNRQFYSAMSSSESSLKAPVI